MSPRYINEDWHMDRYLDKITPQVGRARRTDEIYPKIKGDRKYLFAMPDSETRSGWPRRYRSTWERLCLTLFTDAKKRAKKGPSTMISDGTANSHHAWKAQYGAGNFLHKDTGRRRRRHVHMAGDTNSNQMESFNGNTPRMR